MNGIQVFKFGGASVKDADAVRNVAQILQRFKDQKLVIVVSAMGKTTNALEAVVNSHAKQDGRATALLNEIKASHATIAEQLFGNDSGIQELLEQTFAEAESELEGAPHPNYDYLYDQIICIGELVSSRIVAAYLDKIGLRTSWLDARNVVRTDDQYREGWVQWDITQSQMNTVVKPMLERGGYVLTQGFIGSTADNATTTLGREGSDYTAAIFSYCLDADAMSIWKDVPGVLTADPRLFENVVKLDRMSYKEAIEMTYYGAKVIHPKTIKPLQNKSIPLYVKSFLNPDAGGTMIAANVDDRYPPLIAVEGNQALINIAARDFSFIAEHHLRYLFQQIADHRLQVNLMQNTALNFSISVNDIDQRVEDFAKAIENDFQVVIDRGLELLTCRHFTEDTVENLKRGKIVFAEARIPQTIQLVVRDVPNMVRREVPLPSAKGL